MAIVVRRIPASNLPKLKTGMTVGMSLVASYVAYHYWRRRLGKEDRFSNISMFRLFYMSTFFVYFSLAYFKGGKPSGN